MPIRTAIAAGLAALALAGCVPFPDLGPEAEAAAAAAEYPELLPDAAFVQPPGTAPAAEAAITARRDALRGRAADTEAPVIDDYTRSLISP